MAENKIKVHLANDTTKSVQVNSHTTAEDVCIYLCKELNVKPVARHLFALKVHSKPIYLTPCAKFFNKNGKLDKDEEYDLRIRFRANSFSKLESIDADAWEYQFLQARQDVYEDRIPQLLVDELRPDLIGLGIIDMYRIMLEKNMSLNEIESNYRKYMPKEVVKKHQFFIKKSVVDGLSEMEASGCSLHYVKQQYLNNLVELVPEYLAEYFSATIVSINGSVNEEVYLKVSQFSMDPGVTYSLTSKKNSKHEQYKILSQTWFHISTIEDLAYMWINKDNTIEISTKTGLPIFRHRTRMMQKIVRRWESSKCLDPTKKNGLPFHLKFDSEAAMYSFISCIDGYFRLSVKWIYNLCSNIVVPSLLKLRKRKSHGPISGQFSYAKLERKVKNQHGCFIIRESEHRYDTYYIDLCTKDSSKPKTYKLVEIRDNELKFNNTEPTYGSIQELMAAYKDENSPIYLKDYVPPSEDDKSHLLLCERIVTIKYSKTDISAIDFKLPTCINVQDLLIFRNNRKVSSQNVTTMYKAIWRYTKGKKVEVAMKVLNSDRTDRYIKQMMDMSGKWVYLDCNAIVKVLGVVLCTNFSLITEYFQLGPLDAYLRQNKTIMTTADLIDAASNLASALWFLQSKNLYHGKIRCRKLLVYCHDEYSFQVKLAEPGIHESIEKSEIHWIPIECYSNLKNIQKTPAEVWSFGTTLWEIFNFGKKIKLKETWEQLKTLYAKGQRLALPPHCPDEINKLILQCWKDNPKERIPPQEIVRDISKMFEIYTRVEHSYNQIEKSNGIINRSESRTSTYTNDSDRTSSTFAIDDFSSRYTNDCDDPDLDRLVYVETGPFEVDLDIDMTRAPSSSFASISGIFELDDCNVILQGLIGQGFFGEVFKGELEYCNEPSKAPVAVAVKKMKKTALANVKKEFQNEIDIMMQLKHSNIVQILGVQKDSEVLLVMEYLPRGSLQCFLKVYKDHLTIKQLLKYSLDIAKGMDYLGQKKIVHRDLAARNILVVDNDTVKISDFGLARPMDSGNYYMIKTEGRELPMKWYAPESLEEGKFSQRSDVWSYGVTLWEMFTYGDDPKLMIDGKEVEPDPTTFVGFLRRGERFPYKPQIPNLVYSDYMQECWRLDPHARPTFTKIAVSLQNDIINDRFC